MKAVSEKEEKTSGSNSWHLATLMHRFRHYWNSSQWHNGRLAPAADGSMSQKKRTILTVLGPLINRGKWRQRCFLWCLSGMYWDVSPSRDVTQQFLDFQNLGLGVPWEVWPGELYFQVFKLPVKHAPSLAFAGAFVGRTAVSSGAGRGWEKNCCSLVLSARFLSVCIFGVLWFSSPSSLRIFSMF